MCLTSTVLGSVLGGGGCVVSVRERVCVCVAKIVARKFEVIGAIGGKKGKIKLIFGLPLFLVVFDHTYFAGKEPSRRFKKELQCSD